MFSFMIGAALDIAFNIHSYVETIEKRQGPKISCIEEIAFLQGCISKDQLAGCVFASQSYQLIL